MPAKAPADAATPAEAPEPNSAPAPDCAESCPLEPAPENPTEALS